MTTAPALPARTRVLVVGSGFAGIATAVRLLERGTTDVVVVERGDDVGGTWRDNTYPGCACDVPSHMYSFSFAPNPDWTQAFSPQPEIHAYLQRVARDRGVLPHVHLRTELLDARWDDDAQHWQVTTSRGPVTADVLVLATGGLSDPSVPTLPGLDSFEGTTFHSAQWRHDHDLTGERVAVVGTGASAIQFVPHVQQHASRLVLFQRTAPWVMPRRNRRIPAAERALYRAVPAAQKLTRGGIYVGRESWILGFAKSPRLMQVAERIARRHLARQVPDPVLRERLTPRYRLGCKRVLLSNDYYPALTRDDVDVVTDGVVEVTPRGVVSQAPDGTRTEHEVDTIIFGTGFRVTDPPVASRVVGRDGRTLAEHWGDGGMAALRGATIAGFPNLFFLVGPNTGLGHNSVVYMIESQVGYVMDALAQLEARGASSMEARQAALEAYNAGVQRDLQGTVWNAGGCSSWYLDAHGRNTTLWPTFTWTFRRQVRRVDLTEYELRIRPGAGAGADEKQKVSA
ncbi:MAG TPA: NAD(P)/FAD-dependent oxidoreductase [Mycobacteriales bacterium]|nr:NAD(P)/FAD-dependent oxidoreductase [Mycobacteriales bacterium]